MELCVNDYIKSRGSTEMEGVLKKSLFYSNEPKFIYTLNKVFYSFLIVFAFYLYLGKIYRNFYFEPNAT